MTESFKKFDNQKPDLSLVDPLVLELYCEASNVGLKKYGRNNWKNAKVEDVTRSVAAILRHIVGYTDENGEKRGFLNGEERDSIDGQRHIASAIWGLVMIQFLIDKNGIDNVFKEIRG